MADAPPLNGLVLAGGESRRMGRDKALLDRDGESQLGYAVRLLGELTQQTFVSARPEQAAEPERARYPLIIDAWDGIGPVAGILSALAEKPGTAWLVLACDLPNVTPQTLADLVAGRDPARPFTAYRSVHNGLPEPLCAIVEPCARAIIEAFVAEGIHCPRKMMIRSDTQLLTQSDENALDNINTPEDLERLRHRA